MNEKDLKLALVCAGKDLRGISEWNVCFIHKPEISRFLDLGKLDAPQSITVTYMPGTGRSLRVRGSLLASTQLIPRSRLQDWQLPLF